MSSFIEAILLLGLASRPDVPAAPATGGVGSEALADLDAAEKPPQEDPRPQPPGAPLPAPEEPSAPLIALDGIDLHVRAGLAMCSKQFQSNPSPSFVIEGRTPIPWRSPSSHSDGDLFGAFAEPAFTSIKRTITPSVVKPRGALMSRPVGIDDPVTRNTTWTLIARAGFQYATDGGVTDPREGMGPRVGLTVGGSRCGGR